MIDFVKQWHNMRGLVARTVWETVSYAALFLGFFRLLILYLDCVYSTECDYVLTSFQSKQLKLEVLKNKL